ncbi:MAG: SMC family ATPase [Gemmatimonadales bacterium]|nr:SMC family ATPase [Gemmatimonadales bacterium]
MLLLRLKLLNFRQHERTDLVLGTGLLAIVGPNGSGKTTLLEAIAYALYGVSAARGTRDTLRRRGAPPRSRCEVELEFALGAHNYRAVRSLTGAELFQDGVAIANSTGAVTERIIALLGMTREEFFNTYFTGQKELAVMAAMSPTERGKFLSRVLGYERLRDAQDRLRERRSARRAELAGVEQGLADPDELAGTLAAATTALETARAAHEAAIVAQREAAAAAAELGPAWEAARTKRTAWQGLDGERRVLEGRVATARAHFTALDRQMAGALDAQRRLEPLVARLASWDALVAERDGLDQAAAAVAARSRAVAERDQLRQRRLAVEAELAALPDAAAVAALVGARTDALTRRQEAEARLAEARTRYTQDEQEARTKLDAHRDRYRELREQHQAIETAGPDGICPTCNRPLGADYRETLAMLQAELDEVHASGIYFKQRVDQLVSPPEEVRELEAARAAADLAVRAATEAAAEAEARARRAAELTVDLARMAERLASLEAAVTGPAASYDATRHEEVRAILAALEPVRREHDQLRGLAERAGTLVIEATEAERVASVAEDALLQLDARIAALGWDPEAFQSLEATVRAAEQRNQAVEVELARSTAAVAGAEKLRTAALARQADRAAKAERARVLGAELTRLQELDRAFADLRTELNLQLRPDLAERASGFLRDLTAGRYADLDVSEEYVATVVEDGEVKPVISGGEEDVVHLALRLAISQMIAERAGQPLALLVLDEIFGSLDDERRQAVLDLLRALQDRFPQVIIISHIEGMRDAVDRVIRVRHDLELGVTTVSDDVAGGTDVAA